MRSIECNCQNLKNDFISGDIAQKTPKKRQKRYKNDLYKPLHISKSIEDTEFKIYQDNFKECTNILYPIHYSAKTHNFREISLSKAKTSKNTKK